MIEIKPDQDTAKPPAPEATGSGDCLICPLTGEIVSIDDVDSLIDLFERVDRMDKAIYATKLRCRELLADKTEGNARTRRVCGQRRMAKVEMPSDSYDQSILKEAWHSFPGIRDQYLSIGTINPRAVEVKKLINTSGPPDLMTFRDMVARANRGPVGIPTVKVEK